MVQNTFSSGSPHEAMQFRGSKTRKVFKILNPYTQEEINGITRQGPAENTSYSERESFTETLENQDEDPEHPLNWLVPTPLASPRGELGATSAQEEADVENNSTEAPPGQWASDEQNKKTALDPRAEPFQGRPAKAASGTDLPSSAKPVVAPLALVPMPSVSTVGIAPVSSVAGVTPVAPMTPVALGQLPLVAPAIPPVAPTVPPVAPLVPVPSQMTAVAPVASVVAPVVPPVAPVVPVPSAMVPVAQMPSSTIAQVLVLPTAPMPISPSMGAVAVQQATPLARQPQSSSRGKKEESKGSWRKGDKGTTSNWSSSWGSENQGTTSSWNSSWRREDRGMQGRADLCYLVEAGISPPFGDLHCFHYDVSQTGFLAEDRRSIIKQSFRGRLSMISEGEVHFGGVHNYAVQFTKGELSSADGVGFVFSKRLPCSKNIQRITSIFVNRAGRICLRANSELLKLDAGVSRLEIGDWVGMSIHLDERWVQFTVWPADGSKESSALFHFGEVIQEMQNEGELPRVLSGHLTCVVKNVGVEITLGS